MISKPKTVVAEIIVSALRELSDAEYQQRVWLGGGVSEMSSMTEATAALFDDSGLDRALEKNAVTFTPEMDAEFRKLGMNLRACMALERKIGTAGVILSGEWQIVRRVAAELLALVGRVH